MSVSVETFTFAVCKRLHYCLVPWRDGECLETSRRQENSTNPSVPTDKYNECNIFFLTLAAERTMQDMQDIAWDMRAAEHRPASHGIMSSRHAAEAPIAIPIGTVN